MHKSEEKKTENRKLKKNWGSYVFLWAFSRSKNPLFPYSPSRCSYSDLVGKFDLALGGQLGQTPGENLARVQLRVILPWSVMIGDNGGDGRIDGISTAVNC